MERNRTTAAPARGEVIRSRDNQWLKRFRAALNDSADTKSGLIGVEGPRLLQEALQSAATVETILLSDSGERHLSSLRNALAQHQAARGAMPRVLRATDALFASVAGTETPQHIAALVKLRKFAFEDLFAGTDSLVVVMVGVQDPGNLGTALRSAEAFGASGVIATRGTAYPWSQKALRASAGSALRVPVLAGIPPATALAQLRISGAQLCASCVHPVEGRACVAPSQIDFCGPVALLIGNEAAGLPEDVLRSADTLVRIPLAPPVESLNAGVAAGLLLYEAARQRGRLA